MTRDGLSRLFSKLKPLQKEPLTPEGYNWYEEALEDLPDHEAERIGSQCVKMFARFPKPAQIIKAATEIGVTLRARDQASDEGWDPKDLSREEFLEGKARGALLFGLLNREGGIEVGRKLSDEPQLREQLVKAIAEGRATVEETVFDLLGTVEGKAAPERVEGEAAPERVEGEEALEAEFMAPPPPEGNSYSMEDLW